ncbi:MAG: TrmH family RNA methyltransferase [Solirubrobacteraceae bacterium]
MPERDVGRAPRTRDGRASPPRGGARGARGARPTRATAEPAGLLYGRNPVREALRGRRSSTVTAIRATERTAREPWLAEQRLSVLDAEEIARATGTDAHQGVCAEVGSYPYVDAGELLRGSDPLVVVLDHVTDPQNLGAICRTAECAGATGVVIHERRAVSVTPAVCRASAGAVEHVRLARVRNIADFLAEGKRAGCWCYGALAPRDGADVLAYDEPDYGGGVVLVLGSEGGGLRPRVERACDVLVSLPLLGEVSSLGVSAAAAAMLYWIVHARTRRP